MEPSQPLIRNDDSRYTQERYSGDDIVVPITVLDSEQEGHHDGEEEEEEEVPLQTEERAGRVSRSDEDDVYDEYGDGSSDYDASVFTTVDDPITHMPSAPAPRALPRRQRSLSSLLLSSSSSLSWHSLLLNDDGGTMMGNTIHPSSSPTTTNIMTDVSLDIVNAALAVLENDRYRNDELGDRRRMNNRSSSARLSSRRQKDQRTRRKEQLQQMRDSSPAAVAAE
jgi:hypothetical protein